MVMIRKMLARGGLFVILWGIVFELNAAQDLCPLIYQESVLTETDELNDIGVADIMNLNLLDIFTTNHAHRQSILLNQKGYFVDRTAQVSLSHDINFPNSEQQSNTPKFDSVGLWIYWINKTLIIRSKSLNTLGSIQGKLRIPNTGVVRTQDRIKITKGSFDSNSWPAWPSPERTDLVVYELVISADGILEIDFPGGPTAQFSFSDSLSRQLIHIGQDGINPQSNEFSVILKDRHGMAWADYDGDGKTDVFVSLGGYGGRANQIVPSLQDELLINQQGKFIESKTSVGLNKNGCPGRSVQWVDFNNDGLLDLYVVCGRQIFENKEVQRNQLFKRNKDGSFKDVAAAMGVDFVGDGLAMWIDVDGDGWQDIVWAGRNGIWLYRNKNNLFLAKQLSNVNDVTKLSAGDFNNNGYIGVFAASPTRNVLLKNNHGNFIEIATEKRGLPYRSTTASWVDYDNDGFLDLHTLPEGLFRRKAGSDFFQKLGILDLKQVGSAVTAISWFDSTNLGQRSLLAARKLSLSSRAFHFNISLFHPSRKCSNHWLEFEVRDFTGSNATIGARITVEDEGYIHTQQVGQSEGSRFSQGHYRLYFGLGKLTSAARVRVHWINGKVDSFSDVQADKFYVASPGRLCSIHGDGDNSNTMTCTGHGILAK